jgi:uncharacterized protein VirK/YbjX
MQEEKSRVPKNLRGLDPTQVLLQAALALRQARERRAMSVPRSAHPERDPYRREMARTVRLNYAVAG